MTPQAVEGTPVNWMSMVAAWAVLGIIFILYVRSCYVRGKTEDPADFQRERE